MKDTHIVHGSYNVNVGGTINQSVNRQPYLFSQNHYLGRVKPKRTFEYAQNVRIHIILHMRSLIRAFALHWKIL